MIEVGKDAKKYAPNYPKVQWRGYGHYTTVSTIVNVRGEFKRFVLESMIIGASPNATETTLLQHLHESAFKSINEGLYNEQWDELIPKKTMEELT